MRRCLTSLLLDAIRALNTRRDRTLALKFHDLVIDYDQMDSSPYDLYPERPCQR